MKSNCSRCCLMQIRQNKSQTKFFSFQFYTFFPLLNNTFQNSNYYLFQINKIISTDLSMMQNNYLIEAQIGNGTFSDVYRVRSLINNELYAMKRIKYQNAKQKVKENALNQIRILSSIDHKSIIGYKESFFSENNGDLCVVMQLAENGSLGSEIKRRLQLNQYFSQNQIWKIGYNIIQGIYTLHQRQIIHRDIKPDNILLSYGNYAKIGDMNISIISENQYLFDQVGTPYYSSPQIWLKGPYGYECDIWSFGCVLYEMCSLKKAFDGKNLESILRKIKMCRFKQISVNYSDDLKLLIQRCLTYSYKRISIIELRSIFMERARIKMEKRLQRAKSLNSIKILETTVCSPMIIRPQNMQIIQSFEFQRESHQISYWKASKNYLDKYLNPERNLPRKQFLQQDFQKNYNSNTKLREKRAKRKFKQQLLLKVDHHFNKAKPSLMYLLEDQRQIVSQMRLRFNI